MKPTAKQLRYLRDLAQTTGTTFAPPRTAAAASREIARLKGRPVENRAVVSAERREVQAAMAGGTYDATRHGRDEIRGYGSSACWAHNHDTPETGR